MTPRRQRAATQLNRGSCVKSPSYPSGEWLTPSEHRCGGHHRHGRVGSSREHARGLRVAARITLSIRPHATANHDAGSAHPVTAVRDEFRRNFCGHAHRRCSVCRCDRHRSCWRRGRGNRHRDRGTRHERSQRRACGGRRDAMTAGRSGRVPRVLRRLQRHAATRLLERRHEAHALIRLRRGSEIGCGWRCRGRLCRRRRVLAVARGERGGERKRCDCEVRAHDCPQWVGVP